MPRKTAPQTTEQLATISARDIVAQAKKATGPVWARLSPDGQLTGCRAILCTEMLKDCGRAACAGAPLLTAQWWIDVSKAIVNLLTPSDA